MPSRAARRSAAATLDPVTLRFRNADRERAYRDDYFDTVRISIRVAHVLGIVMWVLWGLERSRVRRPRIG